MHVRNMIRIDLVLGTLVCMLLNIVHQAKRPFIKRRVPHEVRNILFMKFFGMGSLILSMPLVESVRKHYPGARIYYISFASNQSVLNRMTGVDEWMVLRTDSFLRFCRDVVVNLLALRRRGIDMVFDLEFFSRFSMMFSYMTGAPVRVGFYKLNVGRGNLLTHPTYFNHYRHITEVFLALGESVGIAVPSPILVPGLKPIPGAVERVQAMLQEHGLDGPGPRVVINVNASELCLERRWPAELFAALVDYLIERRRVRPILIGSPGERPYVDHVLSICLRGDKAVNLAGNLDFDGLVALLEQSDLLITNDSGPLHLAAMLGVPSVSFFGPETPLLYGPIGNDNAVFYARVYCSPCLNVFDAKIAACQGRNICMQAIGLENVIAKLDSFLDGEKLRPSSEADAAHPSPGG
ncbi:MAG: glycosyltransferase family 9 protein [Deltaproteobacteria bacterium]|nr:glycosyltransferase family 9 protein [Deltaproteobacteria bacterium]